MERIVITLGECSYSITTAPGLFDESASFLPLKSGEQVMLVTSETLAPLHLNKVHGVLGQVDINVDSVILPDSEQYRNLAMLDTVFTASLQKPYGRDTTLVALGSGAVGDLADPAAVSCQRGVRFIQVLTTSLSQVDSSVGDEIAISHPLGKNVIGTFYQSTSVVVDLDCPKTLPLRGLASGLTEIIKYDVIPDGVSFNWLGENLDALLRLDGSAMAYCIRCCRKLKAEAVAAGERETGLRILLNLRYVFGHAIEAEMGYGNWLHGEIVTAGMVMVVRTSERLGQFNSAETQRIIALPKRAGLPVNGPCETSARAYLPHMLCDKEVPVGKMRLILPLVVDKSEVRSGASYELVLNAIVDCQSA